MGKVTLMIRLSPRLSPALAPAAPPPPPLDDVASTASSSVLSLESLDEGESLGSVLADLRSQMTTLANDSSRIRGQVRHLFNRAKMESIHWMEEPLQPRLPLEDWLEERGAPTKPTMGEFLTACFAAATSMDLETRVLTFNKKDAAILCGGQRRIRLYDLIAAMPALFV